MSTTWTTARANGLLALFAAVTFLNATLLFVVQPMFSKMVLPLLGGTPAVWNTCMLFFQAALLLGYLYAHASSRRLTPRQQGAVHLALLVLATIVLPITVRSGGALPNLATVPFLWLLGTLVLSLGLPFTLLAAGAPMFQHWLAGTDHPSARNPYVLYMASNLGSFAALLAYPFVLEPALRLSQQRVWWTGGYVVLTGLIALVWWLVTVRWRRSGAVGDRMVRLTGDVESSLPNGGGHPVLSDAAFASAPTANDDDDAPPPPPSIIPNTGWRLRWTLLSFAPSSLLLGVTTYLSTDVAAVPLLWVVPLAIYLLTFVLVFAERPMLNRRFMLIFQMLIVMALLVVVASSPTKLKLAHVGLHLLGFFATAMVCHRELADTRPHASHLTEFYLWMSFGGVLGGIFNVLIAPALYDRILEYPLALIIALGLRPSPQRLDARLRPVLLDILLPGIVFAALWILLEVQVPEGRTGTIVLYTVLCAAAIAVATFHHRPLRFALGAAALFMAVDRRGRNENILLEQRSFFGVYRVHRTGDFLILQHGTTTHGAQSLVDGQRTDPLTYYTKEGPLGDAFAVLTDSIRPRQVALVGLGTGTTACHARPDERWTHYEIDSTVVRIAQGARLFTYLKTCGPTHEITVGDARLSLQSAPDSGFDLIALDAFSSDAIPVHLITREALALYLRKLKPDGTVLFHISNRYMDLEPVLAQLAQDASLVGAARDHDPSEEAKRRMRYASRWVALSRSAVRLAPLVADREWRLLRPDSTTRLWTDDYSDVIGALRRGS